MVRGALESARPSAMLTGMPGLEDINTIDVVSHDPRRDEYVLHMVEERPWGSDANQEMQLREKINTYVTFATDGSLAEHYPETADARVRLQLDCAYDLIDPYAAVVEYAMEQLDKVGIAFGLNVRGPAPADD